MSIRIYQYSTDTDCDGVAEGYQLHIELFRLVFQIGVAWRVT